MSISYTLKDAGGAGNCFYYSIYEAFKHKNLLDCIKKNLFKFNNNKEDFNVKFRKYLSVKIRPELKNMIINICEYKNQIIEEKIQDIVYKKNNIIGANDEMTNEWKYYFYLDNKKLDFNTPGFNNDNNHNIGGTITIQQLNDMLIKKQQVDAEIVDRLRNLTPAEKEDLSINQLGIQSWTSDEIQAILRKVTLSACKNTRVVLAIVIELQRAIETSEVYVSEIEVTKISEILRDTCNITINIGYDDVINNYVFDPNTIWLKNINEGHYQWFEESVSAPAVPVEAVPVVAIKAASAPAVPVVAKAAVPVVAKAAVPIAKAAVPIAKAASIVIKISTDKSSDTQSDIQSDKSIELTDCVDIDSSLLNKEFQNPSNIIAFILKEFNKKYEDEKDEKNEKDKKDEKDEKEEETNIKLNFKKILLEVNNIEFENKQYTKELICDINLPIINITDLNFIQDINLVEKIVTYRKLEIKKQIIIINYTIEVYKNILIKIKCYEYNDAKKLVNIHKIEDLKTSKETCIDILNKFILQNSNYLQTTLFRYVDLEESLEKIRSNLKLK